VPCLLADGLNDPSGYVGPTWPWLQPVTAGAARTAVPFFNVNEVQLAILDLAQVILI